MYERYTHIVCSAYIISYILYIVALIYLLYASWADGQEDGKRERMKDGRAIKISAII